MDLQTARAGPRGNAETDSQNAMRSGLRVLNTADLEAGQVSLAWSPADRRLAKGGLSECEMALLDCSPVASDPQRHASLWNLGVRNSIGLHVDSVVFHQNNLFEFARDARDASGAVLAVVFMAPDDLGDPLDLAAWEPETGRLALWLGRVSMLADDLEIAIAAGTVTALRRRAARQTELARLGTVESDKTPGVFFRTGEAALADRLANAWAALAQEMEDAP